MQRSTAAVPAINAAEVPDPEPSSPRRPLPPPGTKMYDWVGGGARVCPSGTSGCVVFTLPLVACSCVGGPNSFPTRSLEAARASDTCCVVGGASLVASPTVSHSLHRARQNKRNPIILPKVSASSHVLRGASEHFVMNPRPTADATTCRARSSSWQRACVADAAVVAVVRDAVVARGPVRDAGTDGATAVVLR